MPITWTLEAPFSSLYWILTCVAMSYNCFSNALKNKSEHFASLITFSWTSLINVYLGNSTWRILSITCYTFYRTQSRSPYPCTIYATKQITDSLVGWLESNLLHVANLFCNNTNLQCKHNSV